MINPLTTTAWTRGLGTLGAAIGLGLLTACGGTVTSSAPSATPSATPQAVAVATHGATAQNASASAATGVRIVGNDALRLAEQAAFGPTPDLVAQISSLGSGWIDAQLNTAPSGYAPIAPISSNPSVGCPVTAVATCHRDTYSAFPIQLQFFRNAINGSDQLRQRVALAYSQIFVVSSVQIRPAYALRNYEQMLLADAFVNFRQLLNDVTLSPVMGAYLNMANNNKGNPAKGISPNENYAREILQLFSVGPNVLNPDGSPKLVNGLPAPTYSQDTVEGFASAFTGWTYPTSSGATTANGDNYTEYFSGQMIPVQGEHDTGSKLLLNGAVQPAGQSAQADLKAALDSIFNHPNVGPFIGRQLIQFLVTSNPSPAYVARITAVFNHDANGVRGNMAAVVKAILMDPEARGEVAVNADFGKLREPAVDVAAVMRALGAKSDGEYPAAVAAAMGEPLFGAHTVFSFYPPSYVLPGSKTLQGPQFGLLSTATAIDRLNFINAVVNAANGVVAKPDTSLAGAIGTTVSLAAYQTKATDASALVQLFNTSLLHGTLTTAEAQAIASAVNMVPTNDATLALDRTRTAAYLVLASPRYQITR